MIMDIKPIAENDLEYVSMIMQDRWNVSKEWADTEIKTYLVQDKLAAGFCVHDNGKTVGVGLFSLENEDVSTEYGPWVYLLWVEPEYRGNNLGIELTRKRMDHAKKFGYKEIYLDTVDAYEYHKSLGWEDVCTVNYKGELDYIMKFDLTKDFPAR